METVLTCVACGIVIVLGVVTGLWLRAELVALRHLVKCRTDRAEHAESGWSDTSAELVKTQRARDQLRAENEALQARLSSAALSAESTAEQLRAGQREMMARHVEQADEISKLKAERSTLQHRLGIERAQLSAVRGLAAYAEISEQLGATSAALAQATERATQLLYTAQEYGRTAQAAAPGEPTDGG